MKLNIKDTFNKELPADKKQQIRRQVFDACFQKNQKPNQLFF